MVINPVLVVNWTRKTHVYLSPFAPDNLVSRDRFDRPVPLSAMASIYTVNRHRASNEFIGLFNCVPIAFTAENPPIQGQ